jgi:hypothetical protein
MTMSYKGKKNLYVCETCGGHKVTIDRDEGTTPFIIKCDECGEMMYSALYDVNQHIRPTHQWIAPTDEELRIALNVIDNINKRVRLYQHIKAGGLFLVEIDDKETGDPKTEADPEDPEEEVPRLPLYF